MKNEHLKIQGVKHCAHHAESFGEGEKCPKCFGEERAHREPSEIKCFVVGEEDPRIVKTPGYCATHNETFETVCSSCEKVTQQKPKSALQVQEGGDHYKKLKIQPVEYIHANGLQFAEGSVIKYVTRWRDKNGVADLKKARHFLDLLIELETAKL